MLSLEDSVLNAVKKVLDLPKGAIRIINARLKDNKNKSSKTGTAKAEWAKTGFEQWLSYLVNSVYLAQEKSSPVASLKWKKSTCGVGFFEAGNFCSDFVWCFIDGEKQLGDPNVVLNSLIVLVTCDHVVRNWDSDMSEDDFAVKHTVFQENNGYINRLFTSLEAEKYNA